MPDLTGVWLIGQDREAREVVAMALMQSRDEKDAADEKGDGHKASSDKDGDRRKARCGDGVSARRGSVTLVELHY